MTNNSEDRCLNCDAPIPLDQEFCGKCGQRKLSARLNIRELIKESAVALFGYDDQVWRTLRSAIIPAKLPLLYRQGKRKSLVHPVRFFIVTFIALALFANSSVDNFEEGLNAGLQVDDKVEFRAGIVADTTPNTNQKEDTVNLVIFNRENAERSQAIPAWEIDSLPIDEMIEKYEVSGFLSTLIFKKQVKLIRSKRDSSINCVWVL